jgi:hypothetical protein
MAPLLAHWMGPAPVFESMAVDLFGLLTFQDPSLQQEEDGEGLVSRLHLHGHIPGPHGDD